MYNLYNRIPVYQRNVEKKYKIMYKTDTENEARG